MPDKIKMNAEHRKRHQQLHESLKEIWNDFVMQTDSTLEAMDKVSFFEVYMWSAKQTRGEMENE